MRKLIFSGLVDAMINRVGGVLSNMLLRRLAMHVAQAEASDLASTEEQLAILRERGHDVAVMRLEHYLQAAKEDDPSFALSTSVARQLLADNYDLDNSDMRGDPTQNGKPEGKRRGRKPKAVEAPSL